MTHATSREGSGIWVGSVDRTAFRALFHTLLSPPSLNRLLSCQTAVHGRSLSPQLIEPRARAGRRQTAGARDFDQSHSTASSHRRWPVDQVLQQHAQLVRARVPFEQLSFSSVGSARDREPDWAGPTTLRSTGRSLCPSAEHGWSNYGGAAGARAGRGRAA